MMNLSNDALSDDALSDDAPSDDAPSDEENSSSDYSYAEEDERGRGQEDDEEEEDEVAGLLPLPSLTTYFTNVGKSRDGRCIDARGRQTQCGTGVGDSVKTAFAVLSAVARVACALCVNLLLLLLEWGGGSFPS